MTTLAEAYIRMRPELQRFGADLQAKTMDVAGVAGDRAGQAFGTRFKNVVVGITAAIAGSAVIRALGSGVAESIAGARDLAETQQKVGVVFGSSADAVRAFAQGAATAMGQSQQVALEGASSFAIYGKAAGKTGPELVKFSTNLTKLASDVASFSNEDPAQVIADFGSAMRGEFDPVEKYGILLNETVVKTEALRLGIIKTTTSALTPQQRVLAVQSLLYKQTGDAQGDFARNSAGLANQQRILASQVENLKAQIGAALLPAVLTITTALTSQLMPALFDLWAKHGPAVSAWIMSVSTDFAGWIAGFDLGKVVTGVKELAGAIRESMSGDGGGKFAETLNTLRDSLSVFGVAIKFAAENADLLAKALPYLVGGYILLKTVTIAANAAQAISPITTVAAAVANRRLAASNVELAAALTASTTAQRAATASTVADTAATNTGIIARARSVVGLIAERVAMIAKAVATGIATVAQWALNIAQMASPLTWIIIAIVAVIAVIVLIATKTDWFQKAWSWAWDKIKLAAELWWTGVKMYVGFVISLFTEKIPAAWNWFIGMNKRTFQIVRDGVVIKFQEVVGFVQGVPGRIWGFFSGIGDRFRSIGSDIVWGVINGIQGMLGSLASKAADMAKRALDAAKRVLGISSPSKAFALEVGVPAAQGTIVGMQSMLPRVAGAGAQMGRAALDAARSIGSRGDDLLAAFRGIGLQVVIGSKAVEDAALTVIKGNPEDVALAARKGERDLRWA